MKTSKTIAAVVLAVLAAVGAHAESYDGVQQLQIGNSRADVAAAHALNQNLDPRAFANSEVPPRYQAAPAARRASL